MICSLKYTLIVRSERFIRNIKFIVERIENSISVSPSNSFIYLNDNLYEYTDIQQLHYVLHFDKKYLWRNYNYFGIHLV